MLGLVGGSALFIGASIGFWLPLPQRLIAAVMALGAGLLVSVVAFELMERAYAQGGFGASTSGFVAGAAIFTIANVWITRAGGQNRKRSGCNGCARQDPNAGLAIAVGTLLDGIPESFVIGVSSLGGSHASLVTVSAVFLSNVPEALSSAAGMKRAGHGAIFIFGVWGAIALASAIAAAAGHLSLASASPAMAAAITSLAAGAILAMVVDTMIPEAVEEAHEYTGLITAAGFLTAYILTKLPGWPLQ